MSCRVSDLLERLRQSSRLYIIEPHPYLRDSEDQAKYRAYVFRQQIGKGLGKGQHLHVTIKVADSRDELISKLKDFLLKYGERGVGYLSVHEGRWGKVDIFEQTLSTTLYAPVFSKIAEIKKGQWHDLPESDLEHNSDNQDNQHDNEQ